MRTNKELAKDLLDLAKQSKANIINMKYVSGNMLDAMLKSVDLNNALIELSFEMLKKLK
jgi:hypothetical protein